MRPLKIYIKAKKIGILTKVRINLYVFLGTFLSFERALKHAKAVSLDQWPRSKIPANAKSYHF